MKIKNIIMICLMAALCLCGCGNDKSGTVVTGQYYYPSSETEVTEVKESQTTTIGADLYLIVSNDMTMENLILQQLASGRQYMYYYSLSTRFLDKYGNHTTASNFEPGRVVNIGGKEENGTLKEIKISSDVWEYPDITRYSIDTERGIFKIADTNYSFKSNLFVESDGEQMRLSALNTSDEIRVVGIDKQILSVSVTSGHGELQLKNTEIFEGSYIQIGTKIFAEVTEDMALEIPEGSYTVTVANKGYGGSKEVTIARGETLDLDLDELKGEGPKTGQILFAVDVAGAVLQIDGTVTDYSTPVELTYGIHSIAVSAAGYDNYSKKLFVNSSEATIAIALTDEGTSSDTSETADTTTDGTAADATAESSNSTSTDGTTAGSLAGSMAGSGAAGATGGTTDSTTGAASTTGTTTDSTASGTTSSTTDYLSTLSELLSSLNK